MFDFSKTEAASEGSYLKPGIYTLKVTKGEAGTTKENKTPFVALTFENEDGLGVTEKFMITEKALGRLQYLYQGATGKKLEKAFKSAKEVSDFFIKTFTAAKAPALNIVVGGEINGKITYANLPYTNFIAGEDAELGEFEEGDDNWKKYVKKSTRTNESSGKKQGILNDTDADKNDDKTDDEETPW